MSKETRDDSDLGVLATLRASLSLPLPLAADRDLEPRRFLLPPFRLSFNLDLRFGVLTVFDFFGGSGSGKARFRLETEEARDGGLCNRKYIQSNLDISNSDISNSAKFEASI